MYLETWFEAFDYLSHAANVTKTTMSTHHPSCIKLRCLNMNAKPMTTQKKFSWYF